MGKPIKLNPAHKGLLHQELGIPQGQPVPMSKIKEKLAGATGKFKKRLVFAESVKEGKIGGKK
jgi:hypothetical protein